LANQKGGVAKTTTAVNIAAGLALLEKKVLLVDLDPQGNLTEGLGFDPDSLEKTTYDLIMENASVSDVMLQRSENLFVLPANIELSGAEVELLSLAGKDQRLRSALAGVEGFDYIIIDLPPSLGQLTINGLTAAREVMIPCSAEFYALKGLKRLIGTIDDIRKWSNPSLEITGIIVTFYHSSKNLCKEVVEHLRTHFGDKVFQTYIRQITKLAESPMAGLDIFSYDKNSKGAWDYKGLCDEIAAMEVKING
jgi:chromosome partitioning protein